MTPDEAMTDPECLAQSETAGLDDDEREALGLGIAALKRVQLYRHDVQSGSWAKLPGETEE